MEQEITNGMFPLTTKPKNEWNWIILNLKDLLNWLSERTNGIVFIISFKSLKSAKILKVQFNSINSCAGSDFWIENKISKFKQS